MDIIEKIFPAVLVFKWELIWGWMNVFWEEYFVIAIGAISTAAVAILVLFKDTILAWSRDAFISWLKSPQLSLEFINSPPDCHHTQETGRMGSSPNAPSIVLNTYYVRMRIKNIGRNPARRVECLLKDCSEFYENSHLKPSLNWTPVNLIWSASGEDEEKKQYRDLHPDREQFLDVGSIPELGTPLQNMMGVNLPPRWANESDRAVGKVFLEINPKLNSQPFYLRPGHYRLTISALGENGKEKTEIFEISWDGDWSHSEEEMQKHFTVQRIE